MGANNAKITQEDLDQLANLTSFDKKEIEKMYKQVMKESETGLITGEQFGKIMKSLGVNEDFIAQLLFGVFDRDGDGLVDFKELMVTLSVGSHGTPEEKIALMFRVYDINEDGQILKNEMMKIFTAIFRVKKEVKKVKNNIFALDTKNWASPEEAVDEIFRLTDANGDEAISFEEFRDACTKDSSFLEMMSFFKNPAKE